MFQKIGLILNWNLSESCRQFQPAFCQLSLLRFIAETRRRGLCQNALKLHSQFSGALLQDASVLVRADTAAQFRRQFLRGVRFTKLAQFPSIDRQGLLPKSRLYVHLSADKDTAVKVGRRHGAPVVYTVQAGKMSADGYLFYRSVNGVWLTKEVPTEYLAKQ